MGEALIALGRYDKARQYLEQAIERFRALQSEGELSEVFCLLAKVELAQSNSLLVVAHARRAQQTAMTIGNPEWQGIAERILAQGYAQLGQAKEAIQSLGNSIVSLEKAENQIELAHSYFELGRLLAEQEGQKEQARNHLRQALDLFALADAEKEAAQVRAALIQLN